jgi:hypothetical protein
MMAANPHAISKFTLEGRTHMLNSHRLRTALLVMAGASGLISLAATVTAPLRGGRIDWVVIGVPLGLVVAIAASALDTRHGKARGWLLLASVGLCVASAALILARIAAGR